MADEDAELPGDEDAQEHEPADVDGLLGGKPTGKKPPESTPAISVGPKRLLAVLVLLLLAATLAHYAVVAIAPAATSAPSAFPSLRVSAAARHPALAPSTAVAAAPAAPASSAAAPRPAATAAAPAPATSAASKPVRLRLVINSHVKYSAPLEDLLLSLEKAHFGSHFRDLVVVFGGRPWFQSAERDRGWGSRRSPLGVRRRSKLCLFEAAPARTWRWGKLGVTHINLTLNAFDYNGLSAMYHYRDHPRVNAHAYLYVHDTVLMNQDFMQCFDRLASSVGGDELQIPKTPSSNIFALGHGVVESYGKNFDRNFTKAEAVDLEWKHTNIIRYVKHITNFAKNVTVLPLRTPRGGEDPYHTGVKRDKYRYPYFCLDKFLLNGKHGDIGGDGKLKPNFP